MEKVFDYYPADKANEIRLLVSRQQFIKFWWVFFLHYSLFLIKEKCNPLTGAGKFHIKAWKDTSQKSACEFVLDNAGSIRLILSNLDHNTWLGVTDYNSMHKDGAVIWKRGTVRSHWREACRVAVKHGLRNRNGSFFRFSPFFWAK
jgi:hypothetical protein